MTESTSITYAVEDPDLAESRQCLESYFETLTARFDVPFDRDKTNEVDTEIMRLPKGALILARCNGVALGCGALKFIDARAADIKHVWVSPNLRGRGVGHGLMDKLEAVAAENGYRWIRLDTNRTLNEAISMYRKRGYIEVPAFNDEVYAHHWFEKEISPKNS